MAWYNPWRNTEEKLNPAQPYFDDTGGTSREPTFRYERAYEEIEIVNRAVNMIVDDTSAINFNIGESCKTINPVKGMRRDTLDKLLNKQANQYQDQSNFRRLILLDFLVDGNCFMYWDGRELFHLPATKMNVVHSEKTYVSHYMFNEKVRFETREIIHIKDNSFYSIYRGVSRLSPALRTINLMISMRKFQDNFFKNEAVPGLVIKSPNTLNEKIKARMISSWAATYDPRTGGRRPMILDGGLEIDKLSDVDFRELDFQNAINENEKIILKALGIPPILMDGGNNANIRPNMRLYYLETIMPIMERFIAAFERFFGYELMADVTHVPALQPELKEASDYYSSLVNTGIITANEAREKMGFEKMDDSECDSIRVPANIAGSAANPSEGGRPTEDNNDESST